MCWVRMGWERGDVNLFQVRHDGGVTRGRGPQSFGMLFGWRCFAEDFAAGRSLRGVPAVVEMIAVADSRDGRQTFADARNLGALRAWFGRSGLPWKPRVGPWTLNDECTIACLQREHEQPGEFTVTVTKTANGDIYISDHRPYYPGGYYRIPSELVDMLQPLEGTPGGTEDHEG